MHFEGSLPCVKGGGKILDFDGGIAVDYRHNKDLVNAGRILRRNITKEERHLWYDFLRTYHIRFIRQKIIGNYIVNFYCSKAKLIVELDGSQHYETQSQKKDEERTTFLEQYGFQVIRIPNNEINNNFRGVCEYIDLLVKQFLSQLRLHKGAFLFGKALKGETTSLRSLPLWVGIVLFIKDSH